MSHQKDNSQIDPLLLQAYFDGELEVEERQKLELMLEASDDDALRLQALTEMRELVRFDNEQGIEHAEFGGLWARVQAGIEREEAPTPETRSVPSSVSEKGGGWWQSVKSFFDVNKGVLVPAMVAAGIAALIAVPALLNQAPEERVVETEKTIVIVEPLRFEGNSMGAVSYTPETQTPVIWYLGGDGPQQVPADPKTLEELRQLNVPIEKFLPLNRLDKLGIPGPGQTTSEPTDGPI